jgi:hypothetical protein
MGISLIPGLVMARHAGNARGAQNSLIPGRQKIHEPERRKTRFPSLLNADGHSLMREDMTEKHRVTAGRIGRPQAILAPCEMFEMSVIGRKTVTVADPTGQPCGGERFFEAPQMLLYACGKPLNAPAYAPPIQGHHV